MQCWDCPSWNSLRSFLSSSCLMQSHGLPFSLAFLDSVSQRWVQWGFLSSYHMLLFNIRWLCATAIKKWPRESSDIKVRKGQQHLPASLERLIWGTVALESQLPCHEEPKPHRKARGSAWIDSASWYWPPDMSLCNLLISACRQGFQLLCSNSRVKTKACWINGPAQTPDS